MAVQNDFLLFGTGSGANVMTQSDYALLAARLSGFVNGVADPTSVNKTLRQASLFFGMLAQLIVDKTGLPVVDDGTIATLEANFLSAMSGRLSGFQIFPTAGTFTYTPTVGTKRILIRMVGGGGGGGGCLSSASGAVSAAAGGGSGAYAEHYINGPASTYSVTVGAGGAGGAAGGNPGVAGGSTIFGSLVTCTGGGSGPAGGSATMPATTLAAGIGGTSTGANVVNAKGNQAQLGYGLGIGQTVSSGGADSFYGGGGVILFGASGAGAAGSAPGSGGAGAISQNGGGAQVGGAGSAGSIIIFEFA